MQLETPIEAMKRTSRISSGARVLVVSVAALLGGCIDVLDGPVYRPRVDVVAIDATDIAADRTMDVRDDRVRDVLRMDIPHEETTPDDVADEPIADDAIDAIDATTDVMEIEASFTDGGAIEVITAVDAGPDIPCPTCRSGQTCCAGECVDLSRNEQNCGACGAICPAPGVCQGGACGRCLISLCGAEQRCCLTALCIGVICPR